MSAIRCDIEPVGMCLLVRVHGELSVASAPTVRTALLKCLVEQPDAVVVDLSDAVLSEPPAALVFLAASRQAALWPGTPLLLATPDQAMARALSHGYGRVMVLSSLDEALAAEPRQRTPAIEDTLLPMGGAARHAREIVADGCARWDLPDLAGPAGVIASELVTNAVVHARTLIDFRLTLGRRYLILAVRDGSEDEPVRPRPIGAEPEPDDVRGLVLVDAMAYRWGSLPADGGKVVWATLRRSATESRSAAERMP